MKKYELISDDYIIYDDRKLFRIRALTCFGCVTKGDLGGYIEKESNLSHKGNCWIYEKSYVFGNAHVLENALVFGESRIYDNACICGNARVSGVRIYGSSCIGGDSLIYGDVLYLETAERAFGYELPHNLKKWWLVL